MARPADADVPAPQAASNRQVSSTAQRSAYASGADSLLLSERIDGDYAVRKYVVRSGDDAGYSVRYRINMSTLSSTFEGNSRPLGALDSLVGMLTSDTLARVRSVEIKGYASPDGPPAFNRTLAEKRAQNFKSYVDRKYGFSKSYPVSLASEVDSWEACRRAVAASSLADRQAVLEVLDSSRSPEQKQAALKQMPPAVWNYLAATVLPPLRRVEVTVSYDRGNIVETRTLIPRPVVTPVVTERRPKRDTCCCCCWAIVEESVSGIIVEMPGDAVDFDEHRFDRTLRHNARVGNRLMHDEVRAAERAVHDVDREARRMERAEQRALRRMR